MGQDGIERRKFKRIYKNYVIRLCEKSDPNFKYTVTQVINVSKGGMCFTSTRPFDKDVELLLEMRTPYISEIIFLEGKILESIERVKDAIYSIRVIFDNIDPNALEVLQKIEEYNS